MVFYRYGVEHIMVPVLIEGWCERNNGNMAHMVDEDIGNKNTASVLEIALMVASIMTNVSAI